MNILFGDLSREYNEIKKDVDDAIARVLKSGWFVLGKEVNEFEEEFAKYCGTKYCASCASGTEAIALALMAYGVGPGDEVITTNMTAVPTISAISMTGATPVLVDVNYADCLIDPDKIKKKINSKTKVILPVHLYGKVCDMDKINKLAKKHKLHVIEDACQAHGSTYKEKMAGAIGDIGCFSFYPSKNLGCYGDGGAVVTNSKVLYTKIKKLRNYGQSRRYFHDEIGINSRLDELQAAILKVKLKYINAWNKRRREIAEVYNDKIINKKIIKPVPESLTVQNFHLYVIKTRHRKKVIDSLDKNGIQSIIHYPVNIHKQIAYKHLDSSKDGFNVSAKCAREILSLPIYPQLKDWEIKKICEVLNEI